MERQAMKKNTNGSAAVKGAKNNTTTNTTAKDFADADKVRRQAVRKLAQEALAKSETYVAKFYPELKAAALTGTDALLECYCKRNGEYLVHPAFAESDEDAFARAYAFKRMIHTLIFETSKQTNYLCHILEGQANTHVCNQFAAEWQSAWFAPMDILIQD